MNTRSAMLVIGSMAMWLAGAPSISASPRSQPLFLPITTSNRGVGLTCQATIQPMGPVLAVAFSRDGKTLASGGYQEVLLWDLAGAKLGRRISAGGTVGAVAFLKDGVTMVIGEGVPSQSGAVRLVDVATGTELARFDGPKDVVCSVAVSPDGNLLAASGGKKWAHVWSVAERKCVKTIDVHSDRVLSVAFSGDGKFLVTGGADNMATVWNVGDWTMRSKCKEAQPVRGSAVLPTEETQVLLAIGGPEASSVRHRKIDSPTFRRSAGIGAGYPLAMTGLTKSNRVYVAMTDRTARVIDARNGGTVGTLSGHQDWVHSITLSADETKLATGSADGTVKVWNLPDNRLLATLVQLKPQADEWLMMTPMGYFATSSSSPELVWRSEKPVAGLDRLTTMLKNPQNTAKMLTGEKVSGISVK